MTFAMPSWAFAFFLSLFFLKTGTRANKIIIITSNSRWTGWVVLYIYIYFRAAALLTKTGVLVLVFGTVICTNFALGFVNELETILTRTAASLITATEIMTVTQHGQKIDRNRQYLYCTNNHIHPTR